VSEHATAVPGVILHNGVAIPHLGLGVWQASAEETVAAVKTALGAGYRLIDTAFIYENEAEVGRGIAESDVPRDEIVVTTKLWFTEYTYDKALRAFEGSRRRLGLEVVDLYLLHWPAPGKGDAVFEAWRALERLLADGRVRAIGVSNHTPELLEKLLSRAKVVPAVNQIEVHPYFAQPESRAANTAYGIVTQCWSPIGGTSGSGGNRGGNPGRRLLEEPLLVELGGKYGKSAAQVVLRWHIQHGLVPVPKSARPERIAENRQVFDFELDADDMSAIDALDTGRRGGADPYKVNA
jgi:diketogulonate reductase-like aldo/keto reductase